MFGSEEDDKKLVEDQQKQMAEMEETIGADALTHEEDNFATEPPETDPPMDQATMPPATDPPKDPDETETDAPTTKEPEEDELADIKREMAELREELRLAREGSPKTDPPPTEAPIEEEDFVGDLDPDEIVRDSTGFNKLLNKVYVKGIETGRDRYGRVSQVTDQAINATIRTNVVEVAALQKMSEKFYGTHKDLLDHADKVSAVYEELANANPDKGHVELLKLAEPEVRKRYNIVAPKAKDDDDDPPPRLPRKKGQQRQSPKDKQSDPLLDELDEMDKSLGL